MVHELLGDERYIVGNSLAQETAYLIADSLIGTTDSEVRQTLLDGVSANDRNYIGSILQRRMGEWDIGNGPNPYAEVVYSMFSPVGGS